jgi:thiamine biosynthesis lipoprotein
VTRPHSFRSMGCEVVVAIDEEQRDDDSLTRVRALFDARDRTFTRFASDSELLRVNRAVGPVLVSAEFARAAEAALDAWRQTNGLVDPTLLGALESAGYDRDFARLRDEPLRPLSALPAPSAERGRGGELRLTGRLLGRPPAVRLDLNGVVKSMAVDDAVALLGDRGGWVSAGGDLAATRPLEVALPGGGQVRLEAGGLATSGRIARRWRRGGTVQHHLIDPRSGRPAVSPWEQVTVCGATCLMADVAAKAAFLLGDDGPDWLDARGMPGRFLRAGGAPVVNSAWRSGVLVPACT